MAGLPYRGATAIIANAILQALNLAYRKRLPTVEDVAALRAMATKGAGTTTKISPNALVYVTDAETSYRWGETTTTADNGTTVIKPADVTSGPGRWLAESTSLFLLDDGTPINQATGYLRNVVYYNGEESAEQFEARIYQQRPCVLLDFIDRTKERKSTTQGPLAWATYRFAVEAISFSAQADERGFRGSVPLDGSVDPGAWSIAEDVENLLDGATGAQLGVDGIDHCKCGAEMRIVENDLTGRRAVVAMDLEVYASIGRETPSSAAPALTSIHAQPQVAMVRPPGEDVDPENVIVSGLRITPGMGLSRAPTDGSALIGDVAVTVTGADAHEFATYSDVYRDLSADGEFTYITVTSGEEVPDVTADCLRIGVSRTDGSGIATDTLLAPTLRDFGPAIVIEPEE
jgi:hypothetical protein